LNLNNATQITIQNANEHKQPELCANSMITLIKICTYLLKAADKAAGNSFPKARRHTRKNDKGKD